MNYGLKVPVWYSFLITAVTQDNCWLIAESNLEKVYRVWLKSIALLQKLQNEMKKIYFKV